MLATFLLAALASSVSAAPLPASRAENSPQAEPVRLIFDTDMGNDIDDLLALGMIHALQSRGVVELLAVTITKDHPLAAPFVDAVNHFYGRGAIPIGVVKGGATPDAGRFNVLVEATDEAGRPRYPHDLAGSNEAPEATGLLRQVLSSQPDGSVVIAQVGFSTNLARLLDSPPDSHSHLPGRELVARKVKLLSMMAGLFRTPVDGRQGPVGEYNIVEDLPSARKLIAEWPTPIVFSGWEVGDAIRYPARSIQEDFDYVTHHPLAEAYILYEPPPHERPCWDLTSVLYAIHPDRGYFDISPAGRVSVDGQGRTTFEKSADGPHRYLIVNEPQVDRLRETFARLASQPPG